MTRPLRGVIAAMPTPLTADLEPELAAVPTLLDDLVAQGCHGALIMGTTGEGPSFAVTERQSVLAAAAAWRATANRPEFLLLGATGCANAPETIGLSRTALGLGYDALLVTPAFFFKNVAPVGVTHYYSQVLEALPDDARLLLYHIPAVTGVTVSTDVLTALRSAFGPMVAGLKDSSLDLDHTRRLLTTFPDLAVFTGTDSHLLPALAAGAAGSITALASACGDVLRAAYDAQAAGSARPIDQERLTALRAAGDRYPLVAAVKTLVASRRGLPRWPVRPPLVALTPAEAAEVTAAVAAALRGPGHAPLPGGAAGPAAAQP
jgi:4-hydroxy-tetrahydrodipicolinate synthase